MPSELARRGLEKRSLFLGAGKEAEAAGPWLVGLSQRGSATDEIFDLVGDKPAAVFWACLPGEQAVWRHLRTLNQARVAQPDSGAAADAGPGSEVVLFRHWDPRVLSDVLPVLDEDQYARVLGPSDEAVFLDPERSGGVGVRRLKRFADLPLMPRGMLTLDADQVAALDECVRERSQRKTAAYLRDVAPELAGPLSPADLYARVVAYEASGRTLGLSSELAQMKWAYLMLVTQGRAAEMPEVTGHIRSGNGPADSQVDDVMRQLVGAARARDTAVL